TQIPNQIADTGSVPAYRIFNSRGGEITDRPFVLKSIGRSHTQESGDVSCIMAYYPYYKWAFTVGADGANIFNEVPLIPIAMGMCNSGAGTNFNRSVAYFSNAAKGDCLKQIKLK